MRIRSLFGAVGDAPVLLCAWDDAVCDDCWDLWCEACDRARDEHALTRDDTRELVFVVPDEEVRQALRDVVIAGKVTSEGDEA